MTAIQKNIISRTNTKKTAGRKKKKQGASRVIMSIEGNGVFGSWITFNVPAWCVTAVAMCLLVLLIAVLVSPSIAASFAFALIELAKLLSKSSK